MLLYNSNNIAAKFGQGACFSICQPCQFCNGKGINQGNLYNAQSLKDAICTPCDGKGYEQQFLSFHELICLIIPHMDNAIKTKLPEILQDHKIQESLKYITDIMES